VLQRRAVRCDGPTGVRAGSGRKKHEPSESTWSELQRRFWFFTLSDLPVAVAGGNEVSRVRLCPESIDRGQGTASAMLVGRLDDETLQLAWTVVEVFPFDQSTLNHAEGQAGHTRQDASDRRARARIQFGGTETLFGHDTVDRESPSIVNRLAQDLTDPAPRMAARSTSGGSQNVAAPP